jgi:osmoprotectant transport system permease protein
MIAAGPVIPNFGSASSCVLDNGTFCVDWVRSNWHGILEPALVQHLELTLIAVGIGFGIASAFGLFAHRFRRAEQPFSVLSALLYTIPSLALFQLLVPFTGVSVTTIEIALVGYTLVILFPTIVVGLRAAPPEVLEAARAMGLTRLQVLAKIELPLAVPTIVGGLRIAVVSTISIATIAGLLLPEGLGSPVYFALQEPHPFKTEIYAAGALAVALALACDATLLVARTALTPWARHERRGRFALRLARLRRAAA